MSPNVNHRLWVIGCVNVGSGTVANALLWYGMLIVGKGGYARILYFLLNFSVNVELL